MKLDSEPTKYVDIYLCIFFLIYNISYIRYFNQKALQEMRSAAVLYEKANSAHSAAREMVKN